MEYYHRKNYKVLESSLSYRHLLASISFDTRIDLARLFIFWIGITTGVDNFPRLPPPILKFLYRPAMLFRLQKSE